jgi:UDP-glucose 4-epimerase
MQVAGRKFLITGGASIVGSHIAEHLIERGAAGVVLFDNLSLTPEASVQSLLADKRITLVRGDVRNLHALMDALDGVDGVFATAAFITQPLNNDPLTGIQVNVGGHLNLLEACRWRGVKKLIYSSSIGLYGAASPDVMTEAEPFRHANLSPAAVLYGSSKIMGEQLCRIYQDHYGLETLALRYSTVYGERQHARGLFSLIILDAYDRIRRGEAPEIVGDGREVHDYIHAGDVARANVLAMESNASRESITVATGIETTINDLIDTILTVTGSRLRPVHVESAGRLGVSAATRLKFDVSKAERVIGWRATIPLRDGIKRLIDWREQVLRRNDTQST